MKKTTAPATLSELLAKAKKPLWAGKAYEGTAVASCVQFIAVVGDLKLSEVTTETIDLWASKIESMGRGGKPLAKATINRKSTNIHTLLQYAADREWIEKMPKFTWHRETKRRLRWLDVSEESTLFEILEGMGEKEIALFIRGLIETGMRRSELYGLQKRDVKGDWAHLWDTKNGEQRSVPLTEAAKDVLEMGLPWTFEIHHLNKVWDKVREQMGLDGDEDFVLHMLRHTAATRLLAKSKNVAIVQRLLGHKRIETTMRYAHISDDDLLAAVTGNKGK